MRIVAYEKKNVVSELKDQHKMMYKFSKIIFVNVENKKKCSFAKHDYQLQLLKKGFIPVKLFEWIHNA